MTHVTTTPQTVRRLVADSMRVDLDDVILVKTLPAYCGTPQQYCVSVKSGPRRGSYKVSMGVTVQRTS